MRYNKKDLNLINGELLFIMLELKRKRKGRKRIDRKNNRGLIFLKNKKGLKKVRETHILVYIQHLIVLINLLN